MKLVRRVKMWGRVLLATATRRLLPRLAPGQPPLTADEWLGCRYSFSQFGEDRLVLALLGPAAASGGLYVDIGAHDPVVYSNTLLLYKLGWAGVSVDANEESIRRFEAARPGDRNVCAAVSDERREVQYYRYSSPATNRIAPASDPETRNVLGEAPVSIISMITVPLNELLADVLQPGEKIGFLNIDVEGEDLRLLRHLDWDRYQPRLVAVESHSDEVTETMTREMARRGYGLVGRLYLTLIFCRADNVGQHAVQTLALRA
jgi:FkbM family methyltransferase